MQHWTAKHAAWIWLPGEAQPANGYVHFRKSFVLEAVPDRAVIHVTADCKYRLSVNGVFVGRGPVTTDPKYKQVDVYDVAAHLRPGPNVVAALVLQRHAPTSRLCPARGGFLLELAAGDLHLGTDASWKARWAEEYKADAPYMTHQYGHQEWRDGRKAPVGWELPGFDDAEWPAAVVVEQAETFWPAALELRRVPCLLYETRHPVEVVSYFGLTTNGRPAEHDYEPARQIMNDYPTSSVVAWNLEHLQHPENGPAILREKDGNGVGLVLDLGEEMIGYPFVDIECAAGATVEIGHGETISRGRIQTVLLPESGAEQRYADRYYTREGRQRFEIFDTKGCRYLEIHFNRLADFYVGAKVIIHEVGLIRCRTPHAAVSSFACPDERLNRIWDICRRTALVTCLDWHICDAQREQNNWPEIFQDMLYWQCFGRVEMVRQMIHQFCRAQLADGFILSTFPVIGSKPMAEFTKHDLYYFSTAMFPLIVYLDWLYCGEDERQAYWLDCCAKAYDSILAYRGPHGALANLPGTQWVEWTGLDARDPGRGVKNAWEMPVWNAMAVLVLEKLSEMAEALGQSERASAWRKQVAAIRAASDARYWSEPRQAYPDGIYDGEMSPIVSQSTQAVAVLAGLGSEARQRAAMATALDPQRCDVASGISMMSLFHEALQSLGMDDSVLDRIRNKWGYMLDHGATTTWEAEREGAGGMCFGFAGHPLNYMARTLLGVTPLTAGYREFSVCIAPHGLTSASGSIVTPHGLIEVRWERQSNCFKLWLTVPAGCQAIVAGPRLDQECFAQITLDGNKVKLEPRQIACGTFRRQESPACVVPAGARIMVFKVK